MHLRITGAVLVLLGLVVAGSGVASATLWRPADHLQAEAIAAGATTLLVTDPGVLELADDTVRVRASGPRDSTVVLVIGREPDVRAWVGLDPHTRVTGLADVTTLAAEPGQPVAPPVATPLPTPDDEATPGDDATPDDEATSDDDATPDDEARPDDEATSDDDAAADDAASADEPTSDASVPVPGDGEGDAVSPDPSGSDMWVFETSGEEVAELEWTRTPGRWSLLVASTGPNAGPPTLELTWPQDVVTPWFLPGIWIGAVIAAVGLGLLALGWHRGRGSDTWTEVAEPAPVAVEVPTGPLTRRQLRELEAAQAAGRSRATTRRGRRDASSVDTQVSGAADAQEASAEVSPDAEPGAHFDDVGAPAPTPTAAPAGDVTAPPAAEPAPFVPVFEPRRPGGIVPHVPAAPPARSAPSWPAMPDAAGQGDPPAGTFVPSRPEGAESHAEAPAQGAERPEAPVETAEAQGPRRSRTGKFFQRRGGAASSGPDGGVPPYMAPRPTAPGPDGGTPQAAPPGPGAPAGQVAFPASPSAAQPTDPVEESAPRTASADAWRARWGFVEVPASEQPSSTDDQPETEDGGPR